MLNIQRPNNENHEVLMIRIPHYIYENHKHLIIPCQNHENQNNHRISRQNNENHKKKISTPELQKS